MVEKNIRLKTHLGNGVYDTLHPETNSEIVLVGDKNLDETLGDVTAQLAETENQNADYLNNIENGLRVFHSTKNPKIIWWGDSIGAGTGAPSGRGHVSQIEQSATWFFGKPNYSSTLFDSNVDTTWIKEPRGVALYRVIGNIESTPCPIISYYFRYDVAVKCKIIYSTAPDGGDFDVKINGIVVDTVSCNGPLRDGLLTAEYSIPANTSDANTQIVPKGKVYLHGSIIYLDGNAKTPQFLKLVHGGTKIADYTDNEIVDNLSIISPDLVVMGLIANDYSQNTDLTVFESKYRLAIESVSPRSSVLLLATGGNSSTPTDNGKYQNYKDVFKKLSKEYNCAFVDVDNYWGGYNKGNAMNYYSDSIHPSEKGHTSMADLLIPILFKTINVSETHYFNSIYPNSFKWFEKKDVYNDKTSKKVLSTSDRIIAPNQSGAEVGWEVPIQPIIARSLAAFPQSPNKGQIAFATDKNKIYVCTTEKNDVTNAIWKDVFGDTWTLPSITTLPSPSSYPEGTMFHYKPSGVDSKLYMTRLLADGNTKIWVEVGLTVVAQ